MMNLKGKEVAFLIGVSALGMVSARADYIVDSDLGVLALDSTTLVSGDTSAAGGSVNHDAVYHSFVSNAAQVWGNERVFQFEIMEEAEISVLLTSQTSDVDFFLADALLVLNDVDGIPAAEGVIAAAFQDEGVAESFGILPAGTYYLIAEAYNGAAYDPNLNEVFGVDLMVDSVIVDPPPTVPTDTIDLGILGAPFGDLTIDTETGLFDTELAVFDEFGNLILSDDDGGTGTLSLLNLDGLLDEGSFYLAAAAFNTTFATPWTASSTSDFTGDLVLNYPGGTMTVPLGAGEVIWYEFAIESIAGYGSPIDLGVIGIDTDALSFDTAGSAVPDTVLAIYDAAGTVLFINDNAAGGGTLSEISIPAGELSVGSYFASVGSMSAMFTDSFGSVAGSDSGAVRLNSPDGAGGTLSTAGSIDINDPETSIEVYSFMIAEAPPSAPIPNIDLGVIVGEFVPFTIDTVGSILTTGAFADDTEIGLYDSLGALIVSNDDADAANGVRTSAIELESGLPLGIYHLAAGSYNTTYGTESWIVTSASEQTGTLTVNHPGGSSVGTLLDANEIVWYRFQVGLTTVTVAKSGFIGTDYFIDVKEGTSGFQVTSSVDINSGFVPVTGVTTTTDDNGQPNRFIIPAAELAAGKGFFRVEELVSAK